MLRLRASLRLGALVRAQSSLSSGHGEAFEPNVENLYSEQHTEMRKAVRKIVDTEINPNVDKWEKDEQVPRALFKKLGDAGIIGAHLPTDVGGSGLDFSYAVAISEELGNSVNCGGVPMAIGVQSILAPYAISRFGSDKLKSEFLAPAVRGDVIACLGVSEPGAGSDVSNIQTKAVSKGDDLLISGSKMWISNGMQADWMVCLANTSDAKEAGGRHKNKSLIVIPLNSPGVQRTKIHKIGMHSSDTALFHFDEVRVPKSHIVGEPGFGFVLQMLAFQEERIWGCAVGLGPLERAIRETIEYTRNRKTFGKPILHNQYVHFRFAEMQTDVEASRALLYRAVAKYVAGHDVTDLISMCKLKVGRLCRTIPDECLQFWGGMGYTSDVLISRTFRDARLLPIGAGTDEMMMMIISKYMNILPKDALGDFRK